ncbi:hypothetical protein Tco_0279966, partial [Tanacetum coccineum]
QAISECPKLYVASRMGNIEIPLNVRDFKETLEDAFSAMIYLSRRGIWNGLLRKGRKTKPKVKKYKFRD